MSMIPPRFLLAAFLSGTLFALWAQKPVAPGETRIVDQSQPAERSVRLKDLITIEGVRSNQLIGYGLIVGLNGTGDRQQTLFSAQSLTNLLQRMGVIVSPTLITVKNTAAVIVTATLPPFAQPGTTLDVTAAAMGDARCQQLTRRFACVNDAARCKRASLCDRARTLNYWRIPGREIPVEFSDGESPHCWPYPQRRIGRAPGSIGALRQRN